MPLYHVGVEEIWPGVGDDKGCRNETDKCLAEKSDPERGGGSKGDRDVRTDLCDHPGCNALEPGLPDRARASIQPWPGVAS
jgi:hypothetical protein